MVNPLVEAWEERLNKILQETDLALETRFGARFPLHPASPKHGETTNPQQDGLFRLHASFTPGFGSEQGKGYAIDLGISTLENIPPTFREEVEAFAIEEIGKKLETSFPGKQLKVVRDGNIWKIIGDLTLNDEA